MAIDFKATKVNNNMKPEEKPRYYAKAVTKGTVTLNRIIEDMCEESTLSKADVVAVVAGLSKHLLKNLQEGYTVKIDSLGTFSTSVKSATVDNAEDVHPKDVSFSKINYLPEVKMLESFRAVSFQKVETKEEAKVSKPRGRKPIRRK
nr:HU family DNA-binding protein [uncultured Bacteroides sp.]